MEGKYSSDLFVNRTLAILDDHKRLQEEGRGKPWFTYLSFQNVHSPMKQDQVMTTVITLHSILCTLHILQF